MKAFVAGITNIRFFKTVANSLKNTGLFAFKESRVKLSCAYVLKIVRCVSRSSLLFSV